MLNVFVIGIICATAVFADPFIVKHVALLHRHGARKSASIVNGDITWDGAYLTEEGKRMMQSLGRTLRSRYTTNVIPLHWNDTAVYSRSTGLQRTRTSAAALLESLFPDPMDCPLVDYTQKETDMVLRTLYPSMMLHNHYERIEVALSRDALQSLGIEKLGDIGAALGIRDLCQRINPAACVEYAYDFVASQQAHGLYCPTVLCQGTNLDILRKLAMKSMHWENAYFLNTTYQKSIGYLGYNYLTEVMTRVNTKVQLQHHSAHDTTLLSVYTTLGCIEQYDFLNEKNLPNFAEIILFEFSQDGRVRFYNGFPDQRYQSGHEYTISPLQVKCTSPTGVTQKSSECVVADWVRYIRTRGPTTSDGICYADPDDLQSTMCNEVGTAPLDGLCRKFRAMCPVQGCPQGAILDTVHNYECLDPKSSASQEPVSTESEGVKKKEKSLGSCKRALPWVIVLVLLGGLLGGVGIMKFREWRKRRYFSDEPQPIELE